MPIIWFSAFIISKGPSQHRFDCTGRIYFHLFPLHYRNLIYMWFCPKQYALWFSVYEFCEQFVDFNCADYNVWCENGAQCGKWHPWKTWFVGLWRLSAGKSDCVQWMMNTLKHWDGHIDRVAEHRYIYIYSHRQFHKSTFSLSD